ncbi:TetR/AcrR family transcriptional regulator [Frankia sp. CNm7]|uniref:TetR/AcrR family transcriptional regulator n=1 Tax=Frankia nepalensis TaxID=1836974 RepID=A0A937RR37_9ACTN|nr:TetR/AcrR family transcriptional regulator [Frankia nepalensis]MBL7499418.1 TetR/AcrR family transcriptional regulator [Frankia nepalensis]MBL7515444.1 TetR/AcrR family transcriptional regulator [Frankia nepalensis]MBL7518402.1 TetR/AcrR family transcriptional regulator [Frankia nepalensis]MBL7631824.1 TetR/AcrR family transcriptional regulator [Frankia nepalensis]
MATTSAQTGRAARHTGGVDWEQMPGSVKAAVDRALGRAQQDAIDEIEQILDAAMRVVERVAPAEPRVSDIVAEAGTSNQTFYRYFAGKNDLLHAVMERGILRTRSYLRHQMAKHADPVDQVAAWVEGLLAPVARPDPTRKDAALSRLSVTGLAQPGRAVLDDQLGDLLIAPFAAAGRVHPELDARVVQYAVIGALARHVVAGTVPTETECRHLIEFCAAVAGPADRPDAKAPAPTGLKAAG